MGDDSSDSWLGEFCQQPQHLPPYAVGSREGVMPHLFLPVPPVAWRPGHIRLAHGPQLCVERRAAVLGHCWLPAMPPVSQGLSGCSIPAGLWVLLRFCPTVPGVEMGWLQVILKAAQVVAEMKPELGSPKPRAGQSRVSVGPSSLQAVAFLLLWHSCPALLQPSCAAWVHMPRSSIRRGPLASDSRCATDRSSLQQWWEIERWMRREGATSC